MSGTLQPRPDGGGTEVSYALPEGSAASADQPLVCQFSCCPATIVPATVDAATGRVSCTAPCAKINNVTVTVKTAEGDVLISDYINDTGAESPPSPPKAEPGSGRLAGESRKAYMKREYSTLKPFVIISSSYLLFTITDGALRMIVLLHAYGLGFSAFETAILFTLYEVAGVVTNLLAGVMGAKWGIRATLLTGLSLQVLGIGMLFGWQNEWALEENRWKGMLYVIIAQMWAGIAKDLTKLGGKTVTKLVTPDEKQSKLFQLVSFITGFKNSLKGFGYFLGSALVAVNYYLALGVMMGLVVLAMPWAAIGLSKELGQTRKENISMAAIFKQSPQINWLSAARFFLFGSRDLWFEVALPYFLRDTFFGPGLSRTVVGTYLAVFIIIYGQVQSWSPQLLLGPLRQGPPYTTNKFVGALWAAILLVCPVYLAILMLGTDVFYPPSSDSVKLGTMTAGIVAFCLIFAVNSSVHSYLVVRYSDGNTVCARSCVLVVVVGGEGHLPRHSLAVHVPLLGGPSPCLVGSPQSARCLYHLTPAPMRAEFWHDARFHRPPPAGVYECGILLHGQRDGPAHRHHRLGRAVQLCGRRVRVLPRARGRAMHWHRDVHARGRALHHSRLRPGIRVLLCGVVRLCCDGQRADVSHQGQRGGHAVRGPGLLRCFRSRG